MLMLSAAIYTRFSTAHQDPRSLDDQARRCRDHATQRGYNVVETFADAAVSGAHADREQLRRMLALVEATPRPFSVVIVDDIGRLARNISDFWRLYDQFEAHNVVMVDVQTGKASNEPGAKAHWGMTSVMNDQLLEAIRYKTHGTLHGRALDGFASGGGLFGYTTAAETGVTDKRHVRRVWQIDENQAAIVRRVFTLWDEGAPTYKSIAVALNDENIPAPRDGGARKHGLGWSQETIGKMLANEKYAGTWRWNTSRWIRVADKRDPSKRNRKRIERPESEHVVRECPELAIVDRALFDRVQARIARVHPVDRRGTRRGRPPGGGRTYLTSGLLRCGVCGGPMSITGQRNVKGIVYSSFGCTTHRLRGNCASARTISERKVTGALLEALRALLQGPDIEAAFARGFARRAASRSTADSRVNPERQLEAARRRVSNATRLLVEDPDDADVKRQRDLDRAEVRRLETVVAEACRVARPMPNADQVRRSLDQFLDTIGTVAPERGREILSRVLSPLVVSPSAPGEPAGLVVTGSLGLGAVLANADSTSVILSLSDEARRDACPRRPALRRAARRSAQVSSA